MSLRNAPGDDQTRAALPLPTVRPPVPVAPRNGNHQHDAPQPTYTAPEHSLRVLITTQEFNEFRILDRIYTEQPELGLKTIGWCDNVGKYRECVFRNRRPILWHPTLHHLRQ